MPVTRLAAFLAMFTVGLSVGLALQGGRHADCPTDLKVMIPLSGEPGSKPSSATLRVIRVADKDGSTDVAPADDGLAHWRVEVGNRGQWYSLYCEPVAGNP